MIVVGPLIGAVVVGVAGTGWAFIADGLTFIVSAVCISMMRVRADPGHGEAQTDLWTDVREGIAYVRRPRGCDGGCSAGWSACSASGAHGRHSCRSW